MNDKSYTLYLLILVGVFMFSQVNAQWVKTDYPPQGSVESIAVCGNIVVVGSQIGGIYVSTDNGSTWNESSNGLPSSGLEVPRIICDGTKFYAAIKYFGAYVSTDNGTSWSGGGNGLPNSPYIQTLAVDGNKIFLGTKKGVYFSTDNGANWNEANTGLSDTDVRTLGIIGGTILAGTYTDHLYKSALNNINWSLSNNGLPSNGNHVRSFASISNRIFAGTNYGVYYSDDGGSNWIAANAGMENSFVSELVAYKDNLFASLVSGEGGGVLISTDLGVTWSEINQGFPEYPYVSALALGTSDIFAGGPDGWSVWRRPLSEITSVKNKNNELPLEFSLSQNYPNPFNPSTNIQYSIPRESEVSILIYNILGAEVDKLFSGISSAGNYELNWNASNFPSGIYFLRMSAVSVESNSRFTGVEKLILLK
ncbi:MAG: T9SS type A sorting domain-containing protein [Chlorobi bacterium]|nr:T9SS type A sorting domain-containing protein [Chlorobiota bacterium]